MPKVQTSKNYTPSRGLQQSFITIAALAFAVEAGFSLWFVYSVTHSPYSSGQSPWAYFINLLVLNVGLPLIAFLIAYAFRSSVVSKLSRTFEAMILAVMLTMTEGLVSYLQGWLYRLQNNQVINWILHLAIFAIFILILVYVHFKPRKSSAKA